MTVGLMSQELERQFSVPKALEQNKIIWARSMFRSKKVQNALIEFTKRIQDILVHEFKTKKGEIQRYLKEIRPPDYSLTN